MNVRFEWDAHKANTNATKHGVSFEEAVYEEHQIR